jgi:hypothetical protein
MTVYLLVREEQSAHGFVDSDVIGAYRDRADAEGRLRAQAVAARGAGRLVEGDDDVPDGEWEVSFSLREQAVI